MILKKLVVSTIFLKVSSDPPGAKIQFRRTTTEPLVDTGFVTPHTLTMSGADPYWLANEYLFTKEGFEPERYWYPGSSVNANGEIHVSLRPIAAPAAAPNPTVPPKAEPTSSLGTAFLVAADGAFVTNFHVIAKRSRFAVRGADGAWHAATLVGSDEAADLAILRAAGTGFSAPIEFARSPLHAGERVVVLGFPLAGLLSSGGVVSSGIVSAERGLHDDPSEMQINADIQPGNSGAPVFDEHGRVTGVAVATLDPFFLARTDGALPQGVNFCVKTSAVINLLDAWRVPHRDGDGGPSLSVAETAERGRPSVTQVRADP